MKSSRLYRREPYQLTNGVREAMLQQGKGKGLLVAEGLYYLKFQAHSWMTFSEIQRLLHANFGMSYQLVYKGLQQRLVFLRRLQKPQPGQRGRRPYEYRIPHPDELEAEFAPGQGETPSDPLHKADLRTLTTYRMGLHRQLYIRKWQLNGGTGFVMSRGLMADRLGVSVRTVRTYDHCLNFTHEPNFHEEPVTWENFNTLPRYKERPGTHRRTTPSREWLRLYEPDRSNYRSVPLVKYLAYIGLKEGLEVKRVNRLPNTYYPYQRPPKADYDPCDPVAFYIADRRARRAAGFHEQRDGSWMYQLE